MHCPTLPTQQFLEVSAHFLAIKHLWTPVSVVACMLLKFKQKLQFCNSAIAQRLSLLTVHMRFKCSKDCVWRAYNCLGCSTGPEEPVGERLFYVPGIIHRTALQVRAGMRRIIPGTHASTNCCILGDLLECLVKMSYYAWKSKSVHMFEFL